MIETAVAIILCSFVVWFVLFFITFTVNERTSERSKQLTLAGFATVIALGAVLAVTDSQQQHLQSEEELKRTLGEECNYKTDERIESVKGKVVDETIYRLGEKLSDDCDRLIYTKRKPTATEKELCEQSILYVPDIERDVKSLSFEDN